MAGLTILDMAKSMPAPDAKALTSALVQKMGGIDGLADEIIRAYHSSNQGGPTRAKILAEIMETIKFMTDRNATKDDFGMLTEDDIQAEFELLIAKANGRRTTNPELPE